MRDSARSPDAMQFCLLEKVISEWKSSSEYSLYRHSEDTFYVKRTKYSNVSTALRGNQDFFCLSKEDFCRYFLAKYQRTRVVMIKMGNEGQLFLTCSCFGFEQNGYSCRHIDKVVGTQVVPQATDVDIRWHKVYDRLYLKGNEDFDRLVDSLIEQPARGPLILSSSAALFRPDVIVGTGEKEESYFSTTLPGTRPALVPGCFWSSAERSGTAVSIVAVRTAIAPGPHYSIPDRKHPTTLSQTLSLSEAAQSATLSQSADLSRLAESAASADGENGGNTSDFGGGGPYSSDEYCSDDDDVVSRQRRIEAFRQELKTNSAYNILKPHFERLCGVAEKDPEMCVHVQSALLDLTSDCMARLQVSKASGTMSFPANDNARSKRRLAYTPRRNRNNNKKPDGKPTPDRK